MPAKNLEKIYAPESYYHLYNRGVNRRSIFKDGQDYAVFLNLLKRYLGKKPEKDKQGREYPWYRSDIQLLAYCLMPNHYHLLIYQKDTRAITRLMRGVCSSYTVYFNKKYQRVGHLFQDRFKATMIQTDPYLLHISRYIHLNPEKYKEWEFSSLRYYLGKKRAAWINPRRIMELFEGESYTAFLEDYKDHRKMLKEIASELADK